MRNLSPMELALLLLSLLHIARAQYSPDEVCTGTFDGMAAGSDSAQLNALRNRYSKCKKVDGNLEISFQAVPQDPQKIKSNLDLVDFLNNIVEVTGYVLVSGTQYTKLPLRSLRLIRGERLFQPSNVTCSLCLIRNPNLVSFGFESLTEISLGSVYIPGKQSPRLLHVNSVNWNDLFAAPDADFPPQELIPLEQPTARGPCHASCTSGFCFGPTLVECHYPTRLPCPSCSSRCLPAQSGTCCAYNCVGGCVNGSDQGCTSCRQYRDDGRCVSKCPPKVYFPNPISKLPVANPNYKVSYARECLRSCPTHMVDEQGMCLTACISGNREQNGVCVPCLKDEICPTYCEGNDIPPQIVTVGARDYMDGNKIKRFANCTHVSGNIAINFQSFTNAKKGKLLAPEDIGLLSSVEVVTGYVHIQMEQVHNYFSDYSFLGNLKIIHGRYLMNDYSLLLSDAAKLNQVGLSNLKRISTGNILVYGTPCNAKRVNWTLIAPPSSSVSVQQFRGTKDCVPAYSCAEECSTGCWGPSNTMCQSCRNFKMGDQCVLTCPSSTFANNTECAPCNAECAEGCSGPGADQCKSCQNFLEDGVCVSQCSTNYWPAQNKTCLRCSSLCEAGCSGPGTYVGQGGCQDCYRTIIANDPAVPKRCGSRVTVCEVGYAMQPKGANESVSGVLCLQCPPGCYTCQSTTMCLTCDAARIVHYPFDSSLPNKLVDAGYSTKVQDAIANTSYDTSYSLAYRDAFSLFEKAPCLQHDGALSTPFSCPSEPSTFLYRPKMNASCVQNVLLTMNNSNADAVTSATLPQNVVTAQLLDQTIMRPCRLGDNVCMQCNTLCVDGCSGPSASDCVDCSFARVLADETDATRGFTCVSKCPPEKPWRVNETLCTATMPADEKRKLIIIVVSVCIVVLATILAIVLTVTLLRKRARDKLRTREYEVQMLDLGVQEPLMETKAKPDMSKLILIKENELHLADMIGSGAFGTVYRGLWLPEGQRVKIPVAIKVLTEHSTKANTEFMDEVRVMASVHHPCCIRIAGICMGEELRLVTPLMQHGSMLDYLRKHENSIGSRQLLTWATQIAVGMHYLEERSIVHRDLAARNVLVASHNQVRITDFGLAKLLDVNAAEFKATGGKLPIKWLAIECIRRRSFTHKSDVWAFGVTLWEMFTFGSRPYEETPARQLIETLEKGERLQQPDICTIDLYMWMIKCWYPEPASRPSFQDLAEEFAKMSRDPGRYLTIEGDKYARKDNTLNSNGQNHSDALNRLLQEVDADGSDQRRLMDVEDYLAPIGSEQPIRTSNGPNGQRQASQPPLYVAAFELPPPPNQRPPSLPTYDYALAGAAENSSPKYGALQARRVNAENNSGPNSQPDSPDEDRYAEDPFSLIHEIDSLTRQNPRLPAPIARPEIGPRESVANDDYLQPLSTASADYSLAAAADNSARPDDGYALASVHGS